MLNESINHVTNTLGFLIRHIIFEKNNLKSELFIRRKPKQDETKIHLVLREKPNSNYIFDYGKQHDARIPNVVVHWHCKIGRCQKTTER